MPADVLTYPLARLPLANQLMFVLPLRTTSDAEMRKFAVMASVADLTVQLRRTDPGIQCAEASIVSSDDVEHLAPYRASTPWALRVHIKYPEGLTSESLRRRKFIALRGLMSL